MSRRDPGVAKCRLPSAQTICVIIGYSTAYLIVTAFEAPAYSIRARPYPASDQRTGPHLCLGGNSRP